MLCSVVKHLGSGRALKKQGKTLDSVSCFPLHFFRALPLPTCFTTEQSTVEASLFVNHYIARIYPAAATADKYSTAYVGKIIALLGIGKKTRRQ